MSLNKEKVQVHTCIVGKKETNLVDWLTELFFNTVA